MFTGIIEARGTLVEVHATAEGQRLRIQAPLTSELVPGDSLAVNGVCLTAILLDSGEAHFDIGPETARVTTLGTLEPGQTVNLERPMKLDGRLGGHLVLGHVDGIGVVEEIRREADSHWVTIGFPPALAPFFIRKGSVAVDGVSLTVAGLGDTRFDVQIVPFTFGATTFGQLRTGHRVNLECDLIGKYVVRSLEITKNEARRTENGNEELRTKNTNTERGTQERDEQRSTSHDAPRRSSGASS